MRIKIKSLPKAALGGEMPYAGTSLPDPTAVLPENAAAYNSDINDSVKPIDREQANIEAEEGEILLKANGGGVFKIKGKKHSEGGTPLKAEGGDFIFSAKPKLAINKAEAEEMGFKYRKGGKRANTPAEIVKSEIDIKGYNKALTVLNDPKSDPIAKRTAELMLSKYQEKLGQVAAAQESKKGESIPDWAMGTAPVVSDGVREWQDEQGMYAWGGMVAGNGLSVPPAYDPKTGVWTGDKKTKFNAMTRYPSIADYAQKVGYTGPIDLSSEQAIAETSGKIQQYVYDNYPQLVKKHHGKGSQYGMPAAGTWKDKKLGVRWEAIAAEIPTRTTYIEPTERDPIRPAVKEFTAKPVNVPKYTSRVPDGGYQQDNIEWTPLEKLSAAAPFLGAAMMPTYYDMLIQKHTPDVRLDRVDNTQTINSIQQNAALAQREAFANMDPRQAAAAAAQMNVQAGSQIQQSELQEAGMNTDIANRETAVNAENRGQDQEFNLGNIKQTFMNNVRAKQYRNEQIANGAAMSLNNASAIQKNIDGLEQRVAAANMPYLTNVYLDAEGNVVGQGNFDELTDEQKARVKSKIQKGPMSVGKDRLPFFTGFGSLDSPGVAGKAANMGSEIQNEAIRGLQEAMISGDARAKAYAAKVLVDMFKPGSGGGNPYANMMSAMYPYPQQGQ